jgi:hypothetical protein
MITLNNNNRCFMDKKKESQKHNKEDLAFQSHAVVPKVQTAEGFRRDFLRKTVKKEKHKAA